MRPPREQPPPLSVVHYPQEYREVSFAPPRGVYENDEIRVEWQTMNSRQPFYHRNCGVDEISYQSAGERTLMVAEAFARTTRDPQRGGSFMTSMLAVRAHQGADALALENIPVPELGPWELFVVQISAERPSARRAGLRRRGFAWSPVRNAHRRPSMRAPRTGARTRRAVSGCRLRAGVPPIEI